MSKSTLYDIANEFEKSLDNLLDHDDSDLINEIESIEGCLLYTSPSPRDATLSRMPSSA